MTGLNRTYELKQKRRNIKSRISLWHVLTSQDGLVNPLFSNFTMTLFAGLGEWCLEDKALQVVVALERCDARLQLLFAEVRHNICDLDVGTIVIKCINVNL